MSLNFNPLETNLVNLVIVISLLVWFLRGFLGGILERRRAAILQELQDAESRLKTATENLSQAQSELAAAQQKAEKIRADGQARAAGIRSEGEKRTISVMAAIKAGADADADNHETELVVERKRQHAAQIIFDDSEKYREQGHSHTEPDQHMGASKTERQHVNGELRGKRA